MTKTSTKKAAYRLLSLMLSLLVIIQFAAVAFAQTQITLSVDNITAYPTAEGTIYFGQKLNEGITLTGGEVQYNGVVVPGHFEFANPEYRNSSATPYRPPMIFVPDDTEMYTSFDVPASRNTSVDIQKATPVFIDENDTIPVATAVEPGAQLKTSLLSGAHVKNPYYAEEPKALAGVWKWTQGTTVVSESGYYEARLTIAGYERLYAQVYVKVNSTIPETSIAEYPVIPELMYDPNVSWADIELTGGKAVFKGTDTEVAGKFAIKDTRLSGTPSVFSKEIEIVFTPDDPEAALPYEFLIPVTVKPCPISFGPEHKGTSIDDPYILEVAPYADMGDVSYELKYNHLNWPRTGVAGFYNENTTAVNGQVYEYKVLNYNNDNYTGSVVYVKLVFATTVINPTIKSASGDNRFKVDCGTHNPPGTFTIFCNDVEIATARREEAYVFDCEVYTVAGGTSHIVAKYNPVENDYFVCSDAEITITVPPVHTITNAHKDGGNRFYVETLVGEIRTGTPVELRASLDSFVYWIIKDADGKEVTLDGVDVNSKTISFLMPDCDLYVTYKTQYDIEREEAIANCKHMCHSDNEFVRLFWQFINFFNRLFNVNQYCECGEMHYSAPLFPIAK